MRCHNNNQKSKSTGISYKGFQKNGNDKETDEYRNTLILLFMLDGPMTASESILGMASTLTVIIHP